MRQSTVTAAEQQSRNAAMPRSRRTRPDPSAVLKVTSSGAHATPDRVGEYRHRYGQEPRVIRPLPRAGFAGPAPGLEVYQTLIPRGPRRGAVASRSDLAPAEGCSPSVHAALRPPPARFVASSFAPGPPADIIEG